MFSSHLHFWQYDRGLLRATAVTRGWNGYRNKSQHRKLTLKVDQQKVGSSVQWRVRFSSVAGSVQFSGGFSSVHFRVQFSGGFSSVHFRVQFSCGFSSVQWRIQFSSVADSVQLSKTNPTLGEVLLAKGRQSRGRRSKRRP